MATVFFAKFPAEQTPQLFLFSDHTNCGKWKKTQVNANHVRSFHFKGF